MGRFTGLTTGEWVLLALAVYLAVSGLVGLMWRRRSQVLQELEREVAQQQQRKPRSATDRIRQGDPLPGGPRGSKDGFEP